MKLFLQKKGIRIIHTAAYFLLSPNGHWQVTGMVAAGAGRMAGSQAGWLALRLAGWRSEITI